MPTTSSATDWPPERLDRLARVLLPVVFDDRPLLHHHTPPPAAMHRLTALAATLLNHLPPWCVRLAPRPVVEAAYRQLNRQRLEQRKRSTGKV